MIIWLASYPKSGNTWLRSIISALLYSADGVFNFELLKKVQQFPDKKFFKDLIKDFSNFSEIKKNWIVAQDRINLNNETKLLKTHHGKYTVEKSNFTDNKNTLATIYIVRDPRTLVKSISNHFTLSLNDASKFLFASSTGSPSTPTFRVERPRPAKRASCFKAASSLAAAHSSKSSWYFFSR